MSFSKQFLLSRLSRRNESLGLTNKGREVFFHFAHDKISTFLLGLNSNTSLLLATTDVCHN